MCTPTYYLPARIFNTDIDYSPSPGGTKLFAEIPVETGNKFKFLSTHE